MRKYTLLLSVSVHVVAACALIIAPLLAAASLPSIHDVIAFVPVQVVPPPPQALGGGSPRRGAQPVPARAEFVPTTPDHLPSPEISVEPVAPSIDFANMPSGTVGPVGPGVPDGVLGGLIDAPVRPVAPVAPAVHDPIRISSGMIPPKKTRDVSPIYPPIAVAAKREGIVILEAVIAEDGSVRDVKVLRSVTLLDQAAIDAVRQWRFTPTLLSGQPVPVVMTVTVNFKLN
jgi:protein TonB